MPGRADGTPGQMILGQRWKFTPWILSVGVAVYWIVMGNRYSMWYDEAFSFRQSQLSLYELARSLVRKEANLGPYYIVLWIWEKAFAGPWMARGLSALGTILAIHGVWHLVRRYYDTLVATGAIVVFVVNPFVLRWTLQIRGHTLVMAATVWALVLASDLLRRHDRRSAILLGMVTGLSCAMMLSSSPVQIGIFAALIIAEPTRMMVRRLALAAFVAVIVFAPFVPAFLRRRDQINWVPPLDLDRFIEESVNAIGGAPTAIVYGIATGVVCVGVFLDRQFWKSMALVLIALWGFIGLALVSIYVQPMFVDRYLVASIPLLCVGIVGAATIFRGKSRKIAIGGLAACCLLVSAVWRSHTLPPNHDFRWAIDEIESRGQDGDAVITIPRYQLITLRENWGDGQDGFLVLSHWSKTGESMTAVTGEIIDPERLWIVGLLEDEWRVIDREDVDRLMVRFPHMLERFSRGPLSVQLWSK